MKYVCTQFKRLNHLDTPRSVDKLFTSNLLCRKSCDRRSRDKLYRTLISRIIIIGIEFAQNVPQCRLKYGEVHHYSSGIMLGYGIFKRLKSVFSLPNYLLGNTSLLSHVHLFHASLYAMLLRYNLSTRLDHCRARAL